MNRYIVFTGICYALSTPLGVHIGYLMGQDNWPQAFIEIGILIVIQIVAPVMWIKAQTHEIEETRVRKKRAKAR